MQGPNTAQYSSHELAVSPRQASVLEGQLTPPPFVVLTPHSPDLVAESLAGVFLLSFSVRPVSLS